MMEPDFPTFKRLARKGNLVAVYQSVPADLETPVSSFLKLAAGERHAFLLESAEQEEKIGRYSFIGIRPKAVLRAENNRVVRESAGRSRALKNKHLVDCLEEEIGRYELANPEALPGFCGGLIGYFSYENVQHFEKVRLLPRPGPKIPGGIFFLCQDLILFDHFLKNLKIVAIVDTSSPKALKKRYEEAGRKIAAAITKLRKPLRTARPAKRARRTAFRSNMTRRAFEKKVTRIKEYIRAGDCIQTVLSQRFRSPAPGDDFQIYRALRSINPSPYMFYFRSGKIRLVGSSPELLVKKTGREAEVRPIAGTRPRGRSPSEDAAFEESLKRSPKEMAEHLMLVDLGRNDLGRVCQYQSVHVENFARVERYSHVMHLVSDVLGKLKSGKTAFDLLKAAFPAGTVTGAPKIRAMEIINELEPETRGPYAGSLGYFSFNRDMDMCITIRTLVIDGKYLYLQAGAGIVKDSHPGREYQETVNKARALFKAVSMQETY